MKKQIVEKVVLILVIAAGVAVGLALHEGVVAPWLDRAKS